MDQARAPVGAFGLGRMQGGDGSRYRIPRRHNFLSDAVFNYRMEDPLRFTLNAVPRSGRAS
jgi:hypothetical protein